MIRPLFHAKQIKLIALIDPKADLHALKPLLLTFAGCLFTTDLNETLVHLIRAVNGGQRWFSRAIVEKLLQHNPPDLTQKIDQHYPFLSASERKVLHCIVLGWSNQRIAQELCFSEQTIRNYVKSIYASVGIHQRAALVAHLYQLP